MSVLGCGWFGLVLAKTLKRQGIEVSGSARTTVSLNQISKAGIKALKIVVGESDEKQLNSFFATDCLLIAFPLSAKSEEEVDIMANWFASYQGVPQKVIFISSTAIYKPQGKVSEDSLTEKNGRGGLLVRFEEKLHRVFGDRLTILRFAGLIGEERNPGRFLSGKNDLKQASAPVNLLHLDDAVALTILAIETQHCSGIFNACGDLHPSRKTFYTQASSKLGLPKPMFSEEKSNEKISYKRVDNSKVKQALNFDFKQTNEAMLSILK